MSLHRTSCGSLNVPNLIARDATTMVLTLIKVRCRHLLDDSNVNQSHESVAAEHLDVCVVVWDLNQEACTERHGLA